MNAVAPPASPFVWTRTNRDLYPPDDQLRFRLDTPAGRRRCWIDSYFVDHHILRTVWHARHRLSDQMWRTNQPGPVELRWAKRQGVKTVINLRGFRDCGSYVREAAACRDLGLALVDFPIRSRGAPHKYVVEGAARMFDEIDYPAMMHCKSGADRVGLMSVLYRHLRLGEPIAQAARELHWTRLHFKASRTGVLDFFFETYAAETAQSGEDLLTWLRTRYDEDAVQAAFKANWAAGKFVDWILRRE